MKSVSFAINLQAHLLGLISAWPATGPSIGGLITLGILLTLGFGFWAHCITAFCTWFCNLKNLITLLLPNLAEQINRIICHLHLPQLWIFTPTLAMKFLLLLFLMRTSKKLMYNPLKSCVNYVYNLCNKIQFWPQNLVRRNDTNLLFCFDLSQLVKRMCKNCQSRKSIEVSNPLHLKRG